MYIDIEKESSILFADENTIKGDSMALKNRRRNVAYGFSDSLLDIPSAPIISERAPSNNDYAPLGTLWVDKPNNDAYVLTSIVANVATWINVGGGSGVFASLTVAPGDVNINGGDLIVSTGDLEVQGGNFTVALGDAEISAGILTVDAGIIINSGGLTATTGNIDAVAGYLQGTTVYASGDEGGLASNNALTNVVDTTQGAGTLSILSASANNGDNAGFIKGYVGTTTVYIPYFTTIAP